MFLSFKNKILLAQRLIVLENFCIIHTRVTNKITKKLTKKNHRTMEAKGTSIYEMENMITTHSREFQLNRPTTINVDLILFLYFLFGHYNGQRHFS